MRIWSRRAVAPVTAALLLGSGAALGARAGPATAAPPAPVTIWLAGDSTVADASGNGAVGWGAAFRTLFTNATVRNQAVAARSVQTWLYQGDVTSTRNSAGECALSGTAYSSRWNTMLTGMRPGDYLFVQFGINDANPVCPNPPAPRAGSAGHRSRRSSETTPRARASGAMLR